MESSLDELICSLEADLERLHRDEPLNKGERQRLHVKLTLLRDAKYVGRREREPVGAIAYPDETAQSSIDLAFRCGSKYYAVEHTFIESLDGQREWEESGHRTRPVPGSLDDLPDTRRACLDKALCRKLPKLIQYAERARRTHGGCTSVLLLEFEDYLHCRPAAFLCALVEVLPAHRERLPDEIHLIGTVYQAGWEPGQQENGVLIPTAKDFCAIELTGYREGRSEPICQRPLMWFGEERDWFIWP